MTEQLGPEPRIIEPNLSLPEKLKRQIWRIQQSLGNRAVFQTELDSDDLKPRAAFATPNLRKKD